MELPVKLDDGQVRLRIMSRKVKEADEKTKETLEDWHYWVDRGYEFSD